MPPRPRPGDIFEIPLEDGRLGYGQYVLYHRDPPRFGCLVRVFPGIHDTRPTDLGALTNVPEQFMTFYPLGTAVNQGLVTIVARPQLPEHLKAFPLFKVRCARDQQTGRVKTWWLWDGQREWPVPQLVEEHYSLPILEIISHSVLVDRILRGWTPADEVDRPDKTRMNQTPPARVQRRHEADNS